MAHSYKENKKISEEILETLCKYDCCMTDFDVIFNIINRFTAVLPNKEGYLYLGECYKNFKDLPKNAQDELQQRWVEGDKWVKSLRKIQYE